MHLTLAHSSSLLLAVSFACVTVASASAQTQVRPYLALNLGSPVGQSPSSGVGAENMSDDADHVAGWSIWEPYVWDRGSGMRGLQKLPGAQLAGAISVNNQGLVVGRSGQLLSGPRAVWWDLAGNVTLLHQSLWSTSVAIGINATNQVLIVAQVPQGTGTVARAFSGPLGGELIDLAPGAGTARPYDLNDAGQVCLGVDGVPTRFTPGVGLENVGPFLPERINELGQMVGTGQSSANAVVRYTDGIGWETIISGKSFREVGGINVFGQVVATEWIRTSIYPPNYDQDGYLYTDGLGLLKLDNLVDASQQVFVETVVGISDTGVIACEGSIGPDNRAMLLQPRYVSVRGTGCPGGSGAVPIASAAGTPAAGERIALLAARGTANGSGAFLLSVQPASVALSGGCTLLVDLSVGIAVSVTTNVVGQTNLAATIPASATAGTVHVQFASLDPAAPNGVFALSNAVQIDVQ